MQFPSLHKRPKQSFSLEKRLSFENAQELFEATVEGDSNAIDKALQKIRAEVVNDGKIEVGNLQASLAAIDTAAFETLKKTFQNAYKNSDENTASARARQAVESFRAFAPPIDIVDGQAKIETYFQEYLTLFEKYNTLKATDQRNMLDGDNTSTIPPDVQTWMTTKGYSISLKNENDAIKKKLEGKVKRSGKPFDTAQFPNISLLEQTGKETLVFETGIKDIRPITLDGNTVGFVILDGDGDLTKIDEHGVSYVDSASLEQKKENIITTNGLLKGYRFGADGKKTTTEFGTEGLKPEEKEYKAGAKTFDGEKTQENTQEAVVKRERENLPNMLRSIFQDILKDPKGSSEILGTLIPLILAGDSKKTYNALKAKFPAFPEIDDAEKEKLQANYHDFLASVIGIIPKTVQFFPGGAISETALPKEKQKKAILLLANHLTGTQYEASQVPEITSIKIRAVDGNKTLVLKCKDKGEIAFSATNVKFGGSTYEYRTGENKNPQVKTEVIDKIFSTPQTTPETATSGPSETNPPADLENPKETLKTKLTERGVSEELADNFLKEAEKDKTEIPLNGLYVTSFSGSVDEIQEECDALSKGNGKYVNFMRDHSTELDVIENQYHVPREILVVQTQVESQSITQENWLQGALTSNPLFTGWKRYRLLSDTTAFQAALNEEITKRKTNPAFDENEYREKMQTRRSDRMQTEVENITELLKSMQSSGKRNFSVFSNTSNVFGAMGTPQMLAKHAPSIRRFDTDGNIVSGTFTDISATNENRRINGIATMAQIHANNMGNENPFEDFETISHEKFTAVIRAFRTFDEVNSPVGFAQFYEWITKNGASFTGDKDAVKKILTDAGVSDQDLGYIKAMLDTLWKYNQSTKYGLSILSAARKLKG